MENPFRNLIINLSATGPAAVFCVLFMAIGAVGIWGHGEIARDALIPLEVAVGMLAGGLMSKIRPDD